MAKLTVKDLFEKKGKVKLTELYVTNALEAYAAEKAGIDIQIVSFKKETLRTGVPTNRWFRDAHIKDIREAALTKKREHIYHAAMLDPLTGANLTIDEIYSMTDKMIEAHGNYLPQYN